MLSEEHPILLSQFDQYPSTCCSQWRRGCAIGLSFVIAHLFEIRD
jgi:hypothetical protein